LPTKLSLLDRARVFARRLRGREITHVVPLGLSCRVTHQARTCFGLGAAYPFDWWISPLAGLTRYLAVLDPLQIYSTGALEERLLDGRVESIRSVAFGFELHHEFPRHREAGHSAVSAGWQQHIAAAREKHDRRLARLRDLDRRGNRILFLRHKYSVEPLEPAPSHAVSELWNVLHTQWPRAQIDLLLINLAVEGPLPRGILTVRFEDPPAPPPDEWRGEAARWQEAFASSRLRLDPHIAAAAASSGPLSTGPPN
jgi:hypothetical protein